MIEPQRKIAVLIDSDNAPPSSIESALKKIRKMGELLILRAYGDLTASNMDSWKKIESVQLIHQPRYIAGKNATDMAMVIDAMDILSEGNVDTFCLVSSDSDFTPLAIHLKAKGCQVIGVGNKQTNKAFINACTQFIPIDSMTSDVPKKPAAQAPKPAPAAPKIDVPKKPVAKVPKPAPAAPKTVKAVKIAKPTPTVKISVAPKVAKVPDPVSLLKEAYKAAPHEKGWVLLTQLGDSLHQLDAAFKPNKYGHSTLGKLIRAYPDVFQVKGTAAKVYVKLKS